MTLPELTSDCSQCAGLCCVALAFDKSDMFAIDKPGGVPCPNLNSDFGCSIHTELVDRGFAGCVRYDCFGAGQRIVQEVFSDSDWRSNPAMLPDLMDAFQSMRVVHELLAMLTAVRRLPLSQDDIAVCNDLTANLLPEKWSAESLKAFSIGATPSRVAAFLKSLNDNPDIQAALRGDT